MSVESKKNCEEFQETVSPRELEVLSAIARGYKSREIATALNISLKTVEFHRASLRRKVGGRTAAEIVHRYFFCGVLP